MFIDIYCQLLFVLCPRLVAPPTVCILVPPPPSLSLAADGPHRSKHPAAQLLSAVSPWLEVVCLWLVALFISVRSWKQTADKWRSFCDITVLQTWAETQITFP